MLNLKKKIKYFYNIQLHLINYTRKNILIIQTIIIFSRFITLW